MIIKRQLCGSEHTIRKAFDIIEFWYKNKEFNWLSNRGISKYFSDNLIPSSQRRMFYRINKWLIITERDLTPETKEQCIIDFIAYYYKIE